MSAHASIPTHYDTLGLARSAPDAVVRAAYRALSLIHHPDKTLHLSPEERAHHSSLFRSVQQAYDVLTTARSAYDAELAHHGNRVDLNRSTFHRAPTPTPSPPKRTKSVRLTTPEEKRAMKTKVEEGLAYLRRQRAKRDADDANMDVASLKAMRKIWSDMANEANGDAWLQAHCALQIEAYTAKIAKREQDHADWLDSMSKAKCPSTPPPKKGFPPTPNAPRKPTASRATPAANMPKTPTPQQRAEARKRAEAQAQSDHMRARAEDKARKEAKQQAHFEAKQDAVRAEKEAQRRKAEEQAARDAERIANARAKAAPATPKGSGTLGTGKEAGKGAKPSASKHCGRCGSEHASFAEWRSCNLQARPLADGASFFSVV